MVIGESPLKDAYRAVVWGPWRELLERAPYGWEFRANRAIGGVAGRFAPGAYARVLTNLRRAFPERRDLRRVARATFRAHFANQYASFAFGRITAENVDEYLVVDGLGHLDAAAAEGRGVVLVHPHMGPAQLPLAVLGAVGRDVHQIGGGHVELRRSATGEWAAERRAALERRLRATLHDGTTYLRAPVRALRAGAVVLTAGDGTGGGREIGRRLVRPVLGHPMRVPVTAAWLARTAGARLHGLYCFAEGRRHRAVIGPALPVPPDDDGAADVLAAWLDGVLRAHPDEWLFWDQFEPGRLLGDSA